MIYIEEYAVMKLKQTEEQFNEIIFLLPPYSKNIHAFSSRFSSLIMDICSNIETIFKETLTSRIYNQIPDIEKVRQNNKKNMGDYRNIFETKYGLSKKAVYTFFNYVEDSSGNKSYLSYNPFSKWDKDKSPEWWKTYTDLKHSQLENLENATLEVVINAYAALFLLCSQEINVRIRMVANDYIHGKKNLSRIAELLEKDEPFDPNKGASIMYSMNKHFGYIYQRKDRIDSPDSVFSPYLPHLLSLD